MSNEFFEIFNWHPEKGFGFIEKDGEDVFVHVTSIKPNQERGADLEGVELVEVETEHTPKGLQVLSALTRDEWEKRQKRKREMERRREKRAEKKAADKEVLDSITSEIESRLEEVVQSQPVSLGTQGTTVRLTIEGHEVEVHLKQHGNDSELLGLTPEGFHFTTQTRVSISYGDAHIRWPEKITREHYNRKVRFVHVTPAESSNEVSLTVTHSTGHKWQGKTAANWHSPYLEDGKVLQTAEFDLPWKPEETKRETFEVGSRGKPYGGFPEDYVEELLEERQSIRIDESGVLTAKPEIEVDLRNRRFEHKDSKWRSGWEDSGNHRRGTYRWTWYEKHASLEISFSECTFLGKVVQERGDDVPSGLTSRMPLEGSYERQAIREKVEDLVFNAAEEWDLAAEHPEVSSALKSLKEHILSKIPEPQKSKSLVEWLGDRKLPSGIERGLAVRFHSKPDDSQPMGEVHTTSEVISVVPQHVANEADLQNIEPVEEELWVWWGLA